MGRKTVKSQSMTQCSSNANMQACSTDPTSFAKARYNMISLLSLPHGAGAVSLLPCTVHIKHDFVRAREQAGLLNLNENRLKIIPSVTQSSLSSRSLSNPRRKPLKPMTLETA